MAVRALVHAQLAVQPAQAHEVGRAAFAEVHGALEQGDQALELLRVVDRPEVLPARQSMQIFIAEHPAQQPRPVAWHLHRGRELRRRCGILHAADRRFRALDGHARDRRNPEAGQRRQLHAAAFAASFIVVIAAGIFLRVVAEIADVLREVGLRLEAAVHREVIARQPQPLRPGLHLRRYAGDRGILQAPQPRAQAVDPFGLQHVVAVVQLAAGPVGLVHDRAANVQRRQLVIQRPGRFRPGPAVPGVRFVGIEHDHHVLAVALRPVDRRRALQAAHGHRAGTLDLAGLDRQRIDRRLHHVDRARGLQRSTAGQPRQA